MAHDVLAPFQHDLRIDQGVVPKVPNRVKRLPLLARDRKSPCKDRRPIVVELISQRGVAACREQVREQEVIAEPVNGLDVVTQAKAQKLGMDRELALRLRIFEAAVFVRTHLEIRNRSLEVDVCDHEPADFLPAHQRVGGDQGSPVQTVVNDNPPRLKPRPLPAAPAPDRQIEDLREISRCERRPVVTVSPLLSSPNGGQVERLHGPETPTGREVDQVAEMCQVSVDGWTFEAALGFGQLLRRREQFLERTARVTERLSVALRQGQKGVHVGCHIGLLEPGQGVVPDDLHQQVGGLAHLAAGFVGPLPELELGRAQLLGQVRDAGLHGGFLLRPGFGG